MTMISALYFWFITIWSDLLLWEMIRRDHLGYLINTEDEQKWEWEQCFLDQYRIGNQFSESQN